MLVNSPKGLVHGHQVNILVLSLIGVEGWRYFLWLFTPLHSPSLKEQGSPPLEGSIYKREGNKLNVGVSAYLGNGGKEDLEVSMKVT
ncbi:hypothetical protein VNO77_23623 [Canavalia gladiata]|uniref:Uncharacterized protein n=1 Tax=Canavalia gladiata TaxID=3824 RepID=A0AAN9L844_CANGL